MKDKEERKKSKKAANRPPTRITIMKLITTQLVVLTGLTLSKIQLKNPQPPEIDVYAKTSLKITPDYFYNLTEAVYPYFEIKGPDLAVKIINSTNSILPSKQVPAGVVAQQLTTLIRDLTDQKAGVLYRDTQDGLKNQFFVLVYSDYLTKVDFLVGGVGRVTLPAEPDRKINCFDFSKISKEANLVIFCKDLEPVDNENKKSLHVLIYDAKTFQLKKTQSIDITEDEEKGIEYNRAVFVITTTGGLSSRFSYVIYQEDGSDSKQIKDLNFRYVTVDGDSETFISNGKGTAKNNLEGYFLSGIAVSQNRIINAFSYRPEKEGLNYSKVLQTLVLTIPKDNDVDASGVFTTVVEVCQSDCFLGLNSLVNQNLLNFNYTDGKVGACQVFTNATDSNVTCIPNEYSVDLGEGDSGQKFRLEDLALDSFGNSFYGILSDPGSGETSSIVVPSGPINSRSSAVARFKGSSIRLLASINMIIRTSALDIIFSRPSGTSFELDFAALNAQSQIAGFDKESQDVLVEKLEFNPITDRQNYWKVEVFDQIQLVANKDTKITSLREFAKVQANYVGYELLPLAGIRQKSRKNKKVSDFTKNFERRDKVERAAYRVLEQRSLDAPNESRPEEVDELTLSLIKLDQTVNTQNIANLTTGSYLLTNNAYIEVQEDTTQAQGYTILFNLEMVADKTTSFSEITFKQTSKKYIQSTEKPVIKTSGTARFPGLFEGTFLEISINQKTFIYFAGNSLRMTGVGGEEITTISNYPTSTMIGSFGAQSLYFRCFEDNCRVWGFTVLDRIRILGLPSIINKDTSGFEGSFCPQWMKGGPGVNGIYVKNDCGGEGSQPQLILVQFGFPLPVVFGSQLRVPKQHLEDPDFEIEVCNFLVVYSKEPAVITIASGDLETQNDLFVSEFGIEKIAKVVCDRNRVHVFSEEGVAPNQQIRLTSFAFEPIFDDIGNQLLSFRILDNLRKSELLGQVTDFGLLRMSVTSDGGLETLADQFCYLLSYKEASAPADSSPTSRVWLSLDSPIIEFEGIKKQTQDLSALLKVEYKKYNSVQKNKKIRTQPSSEAKKCIENPSGSLSVLADPFENSLNISYKHLNTNSSVTEKALKNKLKIKKQDYKLQDYFEVDGLLEQIYITATKETKIGASADFPTVDDYIRPINRLFETDELRFVKRHRDQLNARIRSFGIKGISMVYERYDNGVLQPKLDYKENLTKSSNSSSSQRYGFYSDIYRDVGAKETIYTIYNSSGGSDNVTKQDNFTFLVFDDNDNLKKNFTVSTEILQLQVISEFWVTRNSAGQIYILLVSGANYSQFEVNEPSSTNQGDDQALVLVDSFAEPSTVHQITRPKNRLCVILLNSRNKFLRFSMNLDGATTQNHQRELNSNSLIFGNSFKRSIIENPYQLVFRTFRCREYDDPTLDLNNDGQCLLLTKKLGLNKLVQLRDGFETWIPVKNLYIYDDMGKSLESNLVDLRDEFVLRSVSNQFDNFGFMLWKVSLGEHQVAYKNFVDGVGGSAQYGVAEAKIPDRIFKEGFDLDYKSIQVTRTKSDDLTKAEKEVIGYEIFRTKTEFEMKRLFLSLLGDQKGSGDEKITKIGYLKPSDQGKSVRRRRGSEDGETRPIEGLKLWRVNGETLGDSIDYPELKINSRSFTGDYLKDLSIVFRFASGKEISFKFDSVFRFNSFTEYFMIPIILVVLIVAVVILLCFLNQKRKERILKNDEVYRRRIEIKQSREAIERKRRKTRSFLGSDDK